MARILYIELTVSTVVIAGTVTLAYNICLRGCKVETTPPAHHRQSISSHTALE